MHGENYGLVGFQFGRDLLKIAAMQQKRVLGNCVRGLTPSGLLEKIYADGIRSSRYRFYRIAAVRD